MIVSGRVTAGARQPFHSRTILQLYIFASIFTLLMLAFAKYHVKGQYHLFVNDFKQIKQVENSWRI